MSEEAGYDRAEILAVAEADMDMLAGLALPDTFTILFPPVFKALWQLLTEAAKKESDFSQFAVGLPRGFGKTTVVKLFCLWSILFSPKQFFLIIGSNQLKAEAILSDICFLLSEPNIKTIFGDWQISAETNNNQLKKFAIAGKTITLAALGAGGDPRGLNIRFKRPDLIIMDDVQSRENALSKIQADTLRGWLFSTLLKTKSPTGCLFIYIGNMFASEDCILKELKESVDWTSFVAGGILADGESLWPELHSLPQLLKELERDVRANNAHIFFSEILNDSSTKSITGFDPAKLAKWDDRWTYEEPQGRFIMIDPSGYSLDSDPTVIALFELRDGVPWLTKLHRGTYTPKATIETGIELGLAHQVDIIVVESIAYQQSLLFWFSEVAKMHGIEGFQFLPISRHTSKVAGILGMFRQLQAGEIGIHPSLVSAVLFDIARFNPQKRNNVDDLLDVLTYSPAILLKYRNLLGRTYNNLLIDESVDGFTIDNCPI